MRRAAGLIEISRRQFCRAAGGFGVAAAVGCIDGRAPTVQTGELDGSGGSNRGDASIDGPHKIIDGPMSAVCMMPATDVGPASNYTLNRPVYFTSGNFFVVKDSAGFYALTAVCTHDGATTCIGTSTNCSASGTNFYCPLHGATFAFDGTVTQGPAFVPLDHFAMCDLPNGHLGVVPGMTVSASTRLAG